MHDLQFNFIVIFNIASADIITKITKIINLPLFQIPNSDAVPAKPFEDCLPALMLSKSFNSGAPEEGGGQGPCPPPPPNFFRQLDLIPTRWGRSCPLYYYFPLPDFFTFLRL